MGAWRVEGKHFLPRGIPEASSCGCDGGRRGRCGKRDRGRKKREGHRSISCLLEPVTPLPPGSRRDAFPAFISSARLPFLHSSHWSLVVDSHPSFSFCFYIIFWEPSPPLPPASPWGLLALAPLPGHLLPLRTSAGEALPRMQLPASRASLQATHIFSPLTPPPWWGDGGGGSGSCPPSSSSRSA